MGFISEARASDSPFVETVTRGRSEGYGSVIRPAESRWHMVVARYQSATQCYVVGPWTAAGSVSFIEGVELLWIKFALGAFMPHLPTRILRDSETALPEASCQSFWLHHSTWQFPTYDNTETFIDRLARQDMLARDPLVDDVLHQRPHGLSARTVRQRFLHATGWTQGGIHQFERAQQAAALLRRGVSIPDTIAQAGYFDQPHLTRSLKRWIGYTPAQIACTRQIRQMRQIRRTSNTISE